MRWALPALEIVCLAVTGLSLGPALFPKESPRLEVSGVRQVRHPDFQRIDALAIISVESEFQEAAVSIVGAKGLMQVRPTTLFSVAEREGLRLSASEIEADPSLNVRLGVRYLKSMRDQFRGNLDLALMAYNAGPTRVFLSIKETFEGFARKLNVDVTALKLPTAQRHAEVGVFPSDALVSKPRRVEAAEALIGLG